MNITTQDTADLTKLKAAILAEGSLAAAVAAGADGDIANWLNTSSGGGELAWKSSMTYKEIKSQLVWTEMDGVVADSKRESFWHMVEDGVDPRDANIRAGFVDLLPGATATKAALTAAAKRTMTRGEVVMLPGGASTVGGAYVLADKYIGNISAEVVGWALRRV